MTKLFINYRTKDKFTKLIHQRLVRDYGVEHVFFDKESIKGGANWAKEIEEAVKSCDAFICVIGPTWGDATGNLDRLFGEDDWVRREIEWASEEGKGLFPVLLDVAKLPKKRFVPESIHSIYEEQYIPIDTDRFERDVKELMNALIDAGFPPNRIVKKADPSTTFLTSLPQLEEMLIGREDELKAIYQKLQAQSSVLLMNGMGGIGKTSLAMKYANLYLADYQYVAWIEQVGTDFGGAMQAARMLHRNLNYTLIGEPPVDAKNLLNLLGHLEGKGLLVLDNMEKDFEAYKDFLPRANWHILLTSRDRLYEHPKYLIELDFLSPEKALELFYEHYTREQDDDLVDAILREIDYHTLTVELFAKTIQKREKSLTWLKNRLEERGLAIGVIAKDVKKQHRSADSKLERIFPYISAVFDLSQLDTTELQVLQQLTCLPPQAYSSEDFQYFLQLDTESEAWDEFTYVRNQLVDKGWLREERNEEDTTWKMHRVVQEVVWKTQQPEYEDIVSIVESVAALLKIDQAKDNPIEKFPFVPFGEYLVELWEMVEAESFADLLGNMAWLKEDMGLYEQAGELGEQALSILIKVLGEDHEKISTRQNNLGWTYQYLGRYEEAANLLEAALQSDLDNFGKLHPTVAVRQSNLANVYRNLGRYEEAAELASSALEIDKQNFGEKHPQVAIKSNNLALVKLEQKHYQEAAGFFIQSYTILEEQLGAAHPNTKTVWSSLVSAIEEGVAAGDAYCQELLEKL
ncbi:MAG: tetratricopeptide repeat protein [Bacteroidota bacterium]